MNVPNKIQPQAPGLYLGSTLAPKAAKHRAGYKPTREIWLDDAQRTHIAVCGGIGTGKSSLLGALAAFDMRKGGPMLIMSDHSDAGSLRRAAKQCGRGGDFNSAELSAPESLDLATAFRNGQILHVGLAISGALMHSQRIVVALQSQLSEIANGRMRMPQGTIRVHLDEADVLDAQTLQLVAHKCGLNAEVALRLSTYGQSPTFATDAAFSTAIILRVSEQTAVLLQGLWDGFDARIAVDLPVGQGIALRNASIHHVTLPRFDAPPSFTERLSA